MTVALLHLFAEYTAFAACQDSPNLRPTTKPGTSVASTHPADTTAEDEIQRLVGEVVAHPDDVTATVRLIEAYVAVGRTAAAETLIEAAQRRFKGDATFELAIAAVDETRQRWSSVVERLSTSGAVLSETDELRLIRALRNTGRTDEATARLKAAVAKHPQGAELWSAWVDEALQSQRPAQALERIHDAEKAGVTNAQMRYRAARATSMLEGGFGKTQIRTLSDARQGQFVDGWLVIEATQQPNRFLCAPPQSALAMIREVLDSGADDPECHLLHAAIWHDAGRYAVAYSILKSRPNDFWKSLDVAALEQVARICLDAGDVFAAVTWSQLRADRDPARHDEILAGSYSSAARVFNERGDTNLYRDYLRRALTFRQNDDTLMLQLADADWTAGDHERAVKTYRALLDKRLSLDAEGRILERLAEWQTSQAGQEKR